MYFLQGKVENDLQYIFWKIAHKFLKNEDRKVFLFTKSHSLIIGRTSNIKILFTIV